MGKHLTYQEKLNAHNELKENKKKIKRIRQKRELLKYNQKLKGGHLISDEEIDKLTQEILVIMKRQKKLRNFLYNSKKSKHHAMFGINGDCFQMYGQRFMDLPKEQKREYMRLKQRESRKKKKGDNNENI